MRRTAQGRKTEFRNNWKYYVFQSLLASVALAVVLIFLHLQNLVIVASFASSIFIIFALPTNVTAQVRNVIGGHFVGLIVGAMCALIPHSTMAMTIVVYSFSVGLSFFLMTVTDTEHPPAAGTTLGVAMAGFNWDIAITVLIASIVLGIINRFCRRYIRDLL